MRNMHLLRRSIVLGLATLLIFSTYTAIPAAAKPPTSGLAIPVGGTATTGTFQGAATITQFVVNNGQLTAVGTLVGTITDSTGNVVQSVLTTFSAPIDPTAATASCTILHLVLGPINLNLLGLQITTNQIVVDISAVPGAGNLLGNLLCSVANLLNGSGLQGLADVLNQILGILQGA